MYILYISNNMNEIDSFIDKLLSGKKSKKNVLDQLFIRPNKDEKGDNPTMPYITAGYWQQADTLYLPNDKGFVYALVVCDVGSQ